MNRFIFQILIFCNNPTRENESIHFPWFYFPVPNTPLSWFMYMIIIIETLGSVGTSSNCPSKTLVPPLFVSFKRV